MQSQIPPLLSPQDVFQMRGGHAFNRKRFGQVFTPPSIAKIMASWVITKNTRHVLDPGAGLGHLLYECFKLNPNIELHGIEIDRNLLEISKKNFGTVQWQQKDYLKAPCQKFDSIIANPPYLKFQNFDYSTNWWKAFSHKYKVNLSKLTNLYVLFIIKIWEDLAEGGRAAILVPSEFFNANYGTELKSLFLNRIHVELSLFFHPSSQVFDNATTTSCILFLRKTKSSGRLNYKVIHNAIDLKNIFRDTQSLKLQPHEKWLNSIFAEKAERTEWENTLSDFFTCKRGIATGANEYFCLTKKQIADHKLKLKDFSPCITKATDVSGYVFSHQAKRALLKRDRKFYLLNPKSQPDLNMMAYLQAGQRKKINKRYLCANRKTWFRPENRSPAPIWVPVFSRNKIIFRWNELNVKNLTCFHGLYPHEANEDMSLLTFLFLNSDHGIKAFKTVNRFYGNGLLKLEPKDVERLPCPDFKTILKKNPKVATLLKELKGHISKDSVDSEILNSLANRIF